MSIGSLGAMRRSVLVLEGGEQRGQTGVAAGRGPPLHVHHGNAVGLETLGEQREPDVDDAQRLGEDSRPGHATAPSSGPASAGLTSRAAKRLASLLVGSTSTPAASSCAIWPARPCGSPGV